MSSFQQKGWFKIVIAVLSAILGALGGSAMALVGFMIAM